MSRYLSRLGRFSFRHRRAVLAAWLLILGLAAALAVVGGGKTSDTFTVPGTQSQQAIDLLQQRIPAFAGASTQVIVVARDGAKVTDTATRNGVEAAVARFRDVPQVAVVSDPFQSRQISPNGRAALITVQYAVPVASVQASTLSAVAAAAAPARSAGAEVEFSGSVYPGSAVTASEAPELVGIVIGFVILLVTFGALIAAGIPLLTAIIGVGIGLLGVTALASVVTVSSAATALAIMLGLSCGIDYALFIASRHRANLLRGLSVEDAVALAVGTSGSSVVFAALTVIVALCGLTIVGIPFLSVMGLAAAGTVAIALLIAVTLLPAVLGFAGHRVTRFVRLPRPKKRGAPGHAEATAQRAASEPGSTAGAAWGRFVIRHRVAVLVLGVAFLGVVALPATRLSLGLPTAHDLPASSTGYKSYALTSEMFGPGDNGPLLIVADLSRTTDPQAGQQVTAILRSQPGVVSAAEAAAQDRTAVVKVIPASGPDAAATASLVQRIRADAPAIAARTGARILVGGTTASNIDTSRKLSSALPVFLIVVAVLALALLTLAFRTILVPVKSIIGFLLSAFAALGAEVAVFQWGWFRHLLGITPSQTVSFVPILLIAIIFGLSSDYEVFLVSRIKEEFTRTGDASAAVGQGTGLSARVVSAAALIMFTVFAAFMFGGNVTIRAIGFSLAAAVLLDAFVVRLTLVPAVMSLVGGRIWYHPRWFARHVPDLDIEGAQLEHDASVVPGQAVLRTVSD
jgi:putative drug exporter of the RND superfamily